MDEPTSDTALSGADGTITPAQAPDLCSCLTRLYELITAPKQPSLIRAELYVRTGLGGQKDGDAGFYITVKSSDEKTLLASVANATHGIYWGQAGAYFWPLVVEAPGATKASCDNFKVSVALESRQTDWFYEIRITLYFSDGTTLVAERDYDHLRDLDTLVFTSP